MNKAVLLFSAVLAFALSPFVTEGFTGWDPSVFPVRIERHPIQPAGYAFALWSLIYLSLVAHAIFGLVKRAEDPAWDALRTPLTCTALVGAVWMPLALISPIWGTLTIWPMAIGAIIAFLRADLSRDLWLLAFPPALLAGWLTAASSVSTGILLAGYGVLAPVPAAAAMLGLVLLIAIPVQRRRRAMPAYGMAVIWALVAVIVVNWQGPQSVAILAAFGAVVMAAAFLVPRRA